MNKVLTTKKSKRRKHKVSPEEKRRRIIERQFKSNINTVFLNAGFEQVATRNKTLYFDGDKGEIDNIFLYENIIVISEDTCSELSASIADHIRKKAVYFNKINSKRIEFIDFLSKQFGGLKKHLKKNSKFALTDYQIKFLYCSRFPYQNKLKEQNNIINFLDYPFLRYFLALSRTIHKTAKYELFKFLGLNREDIGLDSGKPHKEIEGFLLPEARSGFGTDHKIVTFYIDPNSLIELCYVLRKDASWMDVDSLYQRLLKQSKIKNMREFIATNKRVFINNIIVTLPPDAKLIDEKGNEVDANNPGSKAQKIKLQIPLRFNAIGIIDGQHRVFAYHEGNDMFENIISEERKKQNLLLTGIMYPKIQKDETKLKFESKLFMEINDKQTRVRPDLKQAIQRILSPFESTSIAKSVISELAVSGPLADKLEVHFYDTSKIKTTSIVAYGMKHLVKLQGNDTLFKVWDHAKKLSLGNMKNKELLNEYIQFCIKEINDFLEAFRFELSKSNMFTLDKKQSRALTSTSINGLIYCLRRIIENDGKRGFEVYKTGFKKLKINFVPDKFKYKSSHWKALGDEIFDQCFKN